MGLFLGHKHVLVGPVCKASNIPAVSRGSGSPMLVCVYGTKMSLSDPDSVINNIAHMKARKALNILSNDFFFF